METCAVLLLDPKFPHNVGAALRAAACFGASHMWWTGDRVPPPSRWPAGARLPREERITINQLVEWGHLDDRPPTLEQFVPVCVERSTHAESLVDFVHPDGALYVFGPEDGSVTKGWRSACHRFVSIPTVNRGPLNLAAAVNVVLYDRQAKSSTTCLLGGSERLERKLRRDHRLAVSLVRDVNRVVLPVRPRDPDPE